MQPRLETSITWILPVPQPQSDPPSILSLADIRIRWRRRKLLSSVSGHHLQTVITRNYITGISQQIAITTTTTKCAGARARPGNHLGLPINMARASVTMAGARRAPRIGQCFGPVEIMFSALCRVYSGNKHVCTGSGRAILMAFVLQLTCENCCWAVRCVPCGYKCVCVCVWSRMCACVIVYEWHP